MDEPKNRYKVRRHIMDRWYSKADVDGYLSCRPSFSESTLCPVLISAEAAL